MKLKCPDCQKEFRGATGLSWHKDNSCPIRKGRKPVAAPRTRRGCGCKNVWHSYLISEVAAHWRLTT